MAIVQLVEKHEYFISSVRLRVEERRNLKHKFVTFRLVLPNSFHSKVKHNVDNKNLVGNKLWKFVWDNT